MWVAIAHRGAGAHLGSFVTQRTTQEKTGKKSTGPYLRLLLDNVARPGMQGLSAANGGGLTR